MKHALLQLAGLALLTTGAFLAWVPLGFATAGIGLLVLGALMEAADRPPEEP